MRARATIGLLAAALALACSASEEGEHNAGHAGYGGGHGAGSAAGGGLLLGDGGASPGGNGCSEAAKLIYVLSGEGDLYSFKPDEKAFTLVGRLSCPTSMQPNSMAIDRDATAWVNYSDFGIGGISNGAIYRVDTADASCESQPVVTLPTGWQRIGMGYASDGAGSDAETLFVTSLGVAGGLGRIDNSNTLQPIGSFTGQFSNQDAELTGTGDGRLFGYFISNPVEVAEIDQSNAAIISNVPLPTVDQPRAWAFSFWGGDFYLYSAAFGNSRVSRYRPSDGSVDTNYMPDVGFRIVGAGVSTCAPLVSPK